MTDQIVTRHIGGTPTTFDDVSNSVRVVAVTENPVRAWDWEQGKIVDQVLLLSGLSLPPRGSVPLLDSHNRQSVTGVLGSARDFQINNGALECRVYFSSTEAAKEAAIKVREGHLTDFSVGFEVQESQWVPAGQTCLISGRQFTGPKRVITKWYLLELSLTPIGADRMAKARSSSDDLLEEIRTIARKLPILEQQLAQRTGISIDPALVDTPSQPAMADPDPIDAFPSSPKPVAPLPSDPVSSNPNAAVSSQANFMDTMAEDDPWADSLIRTASESQSQPEGTPTSPPTMVQEPDMMTDPSPDPPMPTESEEEPQQSQRAFMDHGSASSGKPGMDIVDVIFYAFLGFMALCLLRGLLG